jgi:4-amino-4-deoxy-L-arabinose transferase-like glycosyltransferase
LAASLSAALLAIAPAAVAVDRSNNMESCLIVVLLCATWLALRAVETGKARPFLLSMVLLGVGFNVKMGAALALAPALVGSTCLRRSGGVHAANGLFGGGWHCPHHRLVVLGCSL